MDTITTTEPPLAPPLTLDQIRSVLADKRQSLITSIRDGIKFKLKKLLHEDSICELLNEVSVNILLRAAESKVSFESEARLVGYILISCWNNYRDSQIRRIDTRKAIYLRDQQREEELFIQEGYQTYIHAPHVQRSKQMEVSIESLRLHNTNPEMSDSDSPYDQFISSRGQQHSYQQYHQQTPDYTDQDITDAHYQELYQKVMTYLEDCVLDSFFTFKEVAIYKQYLINGYTLKQLIAESDFSRTVCTEAVRKIKQHLQTVDFRLSSDWSH